MGFSFSTGGSRSEKPNFVVILLDDAGWRDTGFSGSDYIETPRLDRLAMQGMRFTTAYATHCFCSPSRESMMSGQWPARTAWLQRSEVSNPDAPRGAPAYSPAGAAAWTQRRPEFTSLAEALKTAGYATAHIGKWHFGIDAHNISPESEGFDVNFGGSNMVGAVINHFAPFEGLPGHVDSEPGEYLTDRLTQETIDFITAHQDAPFYVQLWHYAPHTPIQAPEAVVNKYRQKRIQMGDLSLNPTYAAMIDVIDQGIGRIFQTLENLGIDENTIILFTSDNGGVESLGSVPVTQMKPLRGQKGLTYEGGVREPMFIHWPGVTDGDVSGDPVSILDFYPTILDLAGVPLPTGQPVDGVSLVPLLRNGEMPSLSERPLFWYNVTSGLTADGGVFQPVAAVRRGDWRLVKNFERPLELYDLSADPGESVNLAETSPDVTADLEMLLDDWLADTGVVTPTANPFYDPDYIIPRQIETLPAAAQQDRDWSLDQEGCGWTAARMIHTSFVDGAMRMQADGSYPEIRTLDVAGLPAGRYAVQVELNVPTSGRIRFAWKGAAESGNLEFFPQRDGAWHTLTGQFETGEALAELRLAAPTHLKISGHYDPDTQPDWIAVRNIKLFSVDEGTGEIAFFDDFNRADTGDTTNGAAIGPGYVITSESAGMFALESGRLTGAGGGNANILVHPDIATVNSATNRFRLSVEFVPMAAVFNCNLGLAFNVQGDGNGYALRIGSKDIDWQFLRYVNWGSPEGKALAFGSGAFADDLEEGVSYTLTVSSDTPYVFNFTVRSTADGVLIGSGTAEDDSVLYQDGTGGIFYSNAVSRSPFDNLTLER
jgi:arylsulfatase A-like enzyme